MGHAGEAFDKAARLLGLELRPNGGTALENLAREGDPQRFQFSMPLKKYKDCNFSFAGTKTAVRLAIEDQLPEGPSPANRQAGFSWEIGPLCLMTLTGSPALQSSRVNHLLPCCA